MSEEISRIGEVSVNSVMQHRFIDYAMSVNISRSIPDVRDGLKPVHRRILFAMHELGITPGGAHKKSARIVGDVIGKYHPHGDTSVYDAMVRMAQSWSMSAQLVDGQGNFGSRDNDAPAAMRYTEAKFQKIAMELLRDLRPETVDYTPNYDGSENEPSVLPSRFPNLLVNGGEGIGVGMATKMAPHNLREACFAAAAQIRNPDITLDELMEFIEGPDFPTRGVILGREGIRNAFEHGKGTIRLRGKATIEDDGKTVSIVITELPFQVVKENLKERIIELQKEYKIWESQKKAGKSGAVVSNKKLIDFTTADGVRDETDKDHAKTDHVRLVIELKKHANPQTVLNYLYKNTALETTFSINNLSLVPKRVDGLVVQKRPKVLGLKGLLHEYILHQVEVSTRQFQYDLSETQKKAHNLYGLIAALDQLDESIAIIRASRSETESIEGLMNLLSIDEGQAMSILRIRLQTLSGYQQDDKRSEYTGLLETIKYLQDLLDNEEKIREIIANDLEDIAEKHGKARRTEISDDNGAINIEDTIPNDEVVITITNDGFIKRTLENSYQVQRKNGRGVNGMNMHDDDYINHLHIAKNHDNLMVFTNKGRVYALKVYEIPENQVKQRGVSIRSLLDFAPDETIQTVLPVYEFRSDQYVFFATRNGIVKKTPLSDYRNIRRSGILAIRIDEGDFVIGVNLTNGDKQITLITERGMSITFNEEQVNPIGRVGRGVKGIDLADNDAVVSVCMHRGTDSDFLFVATNEGFGKRTESSAFRNQHRGGKGVLCMKLTDKNGRVIDSKIVEENDKLMFISKNGTVIKVKASDTSTFSRNTQGSRIMNLRDGDELFCVARVLDEEELEQSSSEDAK